MPIRGGDQADGQVMSASGKDALAGHDDDARCRLPAEPAAIARQGKAMG